jgi:hypothetical protein
VFVARGGEGTDRWRVGDTRDLDKTHGTRGGPCCSSSDDQSRNAGHGPISRTEHTRADSGPRRHSDAHAAFHCFLSFVHSATERRTERNLFFVPVEPTARRWHLRGATARPGTADR